SKASSHDTWVNSPLLSYLPFFLRKSGCVSRSWPYIILERKYPLTQLRPRLTSALVSPWVATTRPSLVATMTPQPVPQNRHGALFHLSSVTARSVTRFCAASGVGIPPAAAAIAAASSLRNSRRSTRLAPILVLPAYAASTLVGPVKHQSGGEHAGQRRDRVENGADRPDVGGFDHDDELAVRVAPVDLRARQRRDRIRNGIEPVRPRLDQDAGDLGYVVRRAGAGRCEAPGEKGAAGGVVGQRSVGHRSPHFGGGAGGPGGPLIAW